MRVAKQKTSNGKGMYEKYKGTERNDETDDFHKKSKTVRFCFLFRLRGERGKLTQSQLFANQHKLPIGLLLSCILVTVFVTVTEFLFRFSNKIRDKLDESSLLTFFHLRFYYVFSHLRPMFPIV